MKKHGWTNGLAAAVAFWAAAAGVDAMTLRTNTALVVFPSANMTNYAAGFDYSSQGGADMALDSAGNAHIVSAAGDVGHLGYVQYRRWTHATNGWSGPVRTFEGTSSANDNFYPVVTVDAADRVHTLYFHRDTTVSATYGLYHAWCTNATGAAPLTTNNWVKTQLTTITNATGLGSLISVGSNLLLYARGGTDADGNAKNDIRIDRADWNGSGWDWSPVGANGMAISNNENNTYGGLTTPRLTYDRANEVLHLSYRREIYPRLPAYSASSLPTNPVVSTWVAPVNLGAINAANYEGNGGAGVLADGRAVAAVYLGSNRDGMGASVTNYSRVRSAGFAGTWGAWKVAYTNDFRSLGAGGGYATPTAFAPDGNGGLFMISGNQYVGHWDPASEQWADVYTNLPAAADATANASIGVVSGDWPARCSIYHYRRSDMKLYVGIYTFAPPPPRGALILLR